MTTSKTNNSIKFKLLDTETDNVYNHDSKEIEFTWDANKRKLIVWRTKHVTMTLGDIEADVECYDFIEDYILLEWSTLNTCK